MHQLAWKCGERGKGWEYQWRSLWEGGAKRRSFVHLWMVEFLLIKLSSGRIVMSLLSFAHQIVDRGPDMWCRFHWNGALQSSQRSFWRSEYALPGYCHLQILKDLTISNHSLAWTIGKPIQLTTTMIEKKLNLYATHASYEIPTTGGFGEGRRGGCMDRYVSGEICNLCWSCVEKKTRRTFFFSFLVDCTCMYCPLYAILLLFSLYFFWIRRGSFCRLSQK